MSTYSRSTSRPCPTSSSGGVLYGLEGLTDEQVGVRDAARQREQTGSEFLPLEQQRIVAISIALRSARAASGCGSLGEPDVARGASSSQRFFDGIEKLHARRSSPGTAAGFDLPVLHYRALRHGVQAPRYWETGDDDRRSATTTTSAATTGVTSTSWTCCRRTRRARPRVARQHGAAARVARASSA